MNESPNMLEPSGSLLENAVARFKKEYPGLPLDTVMNRFAGFTEESWAICGGAAVASYTDRRISPDLDILIVEPATRKLRELLPDAVRSDNAFGETWTLNGLAIDLIFTAGTADLNALDHACLMRFGNHVLRVVPPDWLLVNKLRTGRDKDHADASLLWSAFRHSAGSLWSLVTFCRANYPYDLPDLLASMDAVNREFPIDSSQQGALSE